MGVGHLHRQQGPKRNWWLARYQQSLIPWLLCFLLGLTLCAYQTEPGMPLPDWTHPWLMMSWLLLLMGLAIVCRKRWQWKILLAFVAILLGGGYYRWQHLQPTPQDVSLFANGGTARIVGEWFTQSETPKNAVMVVQSVNAQPARGRVQVRLSKPNDNVYPLPGSLVVIDGRLSRPDITTIPGAFQEWRFLASQRITAVLHHQTSLEVLQQTPVSAEGYLYQNLSYLRHQIAQTFIDALPSPLSEIQGGIVLGDQAIPVDDDVKQAFIKTGLIHLLAASGMNVAIVAGFLFLLARLIKMPPRGQIFLGMCGAIVYAMLSGLSPSVLRATAMLEIALTLKFLDKTLSHLLVLLLAVVSLLLWNVELVTNVGFQLSVMTTLGIIVMVAPLQKQLGYYIGENLAVTLLLPIVAQLWAAPLLMTYFNQLSLLAVFLNILVVPLVIALTGIGFISALSGLVFQPLGILIAKLGWPLLWFLHWLVTETSSWAWVQWQLPSLSAFGLIIFYGVLFLISYYLSFPKKWGIALKALPKPKISISMVCLMLAALLFYQRVQSSNEVVHVLPLTKHLTAFIIQDGQEYSLLAPNALTPWYSRKIADYCRHEHIGTLSHFFWLPTPTPATDKRDNVHQAVVERLMTQVNVQDVQTISGDVNLSKHWQLTALPLSSDTVNILGMEAAVQPLWQLSADRFCIASAYQNKMLPVILPESSAQCPIQLWDEKQAPYRFSMRWQPQSIPDGQYFKIVYNHKKWQAIY